LKYKKVEFKVDILKLIYPFLASGNEIPLRELPPHDPESYAGGSISFW
jgi:hypothetical protein